MAIDTIVLEVEICKMRFSSQRFINLMLCLMLTVVGLSSCSTSTNEQPRELLSRSSELLDAIRTYETSHKRPPESLDVLVPDYIEQLPSTGVDGSPDYGYRELGASSWQLEVVVPRIPTRTVVLYRSDKNYSNLTPGTKIHLGFKIISAEPCDDWYVVREQTD